MTDKRKPLFGVYIGRFQPWHNGHQDSALDAISKVQKLIIVIGSSFAARDPKNPFTFAERKKFISDSLIEAGVQPSCFKIVGVRDYYYNEKAWVEAVRREVKSITQGSEPIIFGHNKDNSSYYLMSFPDWKFYSSPVHEVDGICLNATEIREAMFETKHVELIEVSTPKPVSDFIKSFMEEQEFTSLQEWHKYNIHYPDEVKNYPINVVTVDSVIFKSGHVLVVKRGKGNGIGLLALPGGHLNLDEEPLTGAIRELREETNLKIMDSILLSAHLSEKVFAHPHRSLRARVITIVETFDLGTGSLPPVYGGDDAAAAFWLPLEDVMTHPENWFEDHWQIVFNRYTSL